ncbi:hypothetical protein ACFC0D_19020 [Streptomyces sp. NPDC056222]|uniref:hypothetical protein n=1 Tax=Streptomyces sp. NPDC056222 TaxID=3345749 RepID=UPI0035DFA40D
MARIGARRTPDGEQPTPDDIMTPSSTTPPCCSTPPGLRVSECALGTANFGTG